MLCPRSSACAYPLSGPSAGVRRSHLVCLCRNGGTIQITAAGVFFLPQSHRFLLFDRVRSVRFWHQQRVINVITSNMFLTAPREQYLTISSRLYLSRSPCPQHLQFWRWERFFRGKVRRLFSRREYPPNDLLRQMNKLEQI